MNGASPALDRRTDITGILRIGDRNERFAACGNSVFNISKTEKYDRIEKGLPG